MREQLMICPDAQDGQCEYSGKCADATPHEGDWICAKPCIWTHRVCVPFQEASDDHDPEDM